MCRIFHYSTSGRLQNFARLVSPKKMEFWRSAAITDMYRFDCHPMELLPRLSLVLLKFIHFPAVVEVPMYIFVMT